jgi:hypothetical protein
VLVFERLWEETGCRNVIADLAGARGHKFALERAVFLTVLHRLFVSGSDRAADRWTKSSKESGSSSADGRANEQGNTRDRDVAGYFHVNQHVPGPDEPSSASEQDICGELGVSF